MDQNNELDLFSPPTEEELARAKAQPVAAKPTERDMFAPPTEEEMLKAVGTPMAGLNAFVDELLLGNLPALVGGIRYALPEKDKSRLESYVKTRDAVAENLRKGKEESPNATTAGKVGGFGASLLVGGKLAGQVGKMLPAAAETVMGSLKYGTQQGALTGAITGALREPGFEQGKVSALDDVSGRLRGGAIGGAIGAPIGAAFGGISGLINAPIKATKAEILQDEAVRVANQASGDLIGAEGRMLGEQAARNEILGAASRATGIIPTPGMASADPTKRYLEDSLANSPSLVGKLVSSGVRKVRGQISEGVGKLLKGRDAADDFDYSAGDTIKQQISGRLKEAYAPIKAAYTSLAGESKNVLVDEASKKRVIDIWTTRISKSGLFISGTSRATAAQNYLNALREVKTLDQLKNLSSAIGNEMRAMGKAGTYDPVLGEILDATDRLSQRTILKNAIQATGGFKGGKPARELAVSMINKMKETDRQYGELKKVLSGIRQQAGIGGGPSTMGTVLDDLAEIPPEKLAKALFTPRNINGLKFIQKEFPEAFESLRAYKLREIQMRSMVNPAGEVTNGADGMLSPAMFFKQVKDLPPTVKRMLFGAENAEKIAPLKIMSNSMPGPINPSGTSRGVVYNDLETFGPTQNIVDLVRLGILKGSGGSRLSKILDVNKLPAATQATGKIGAGTMGTAIGASTAGAQMKPQQMLEGYPKNSLQPLPPEYRQQYVDSIRMDSSLSNTEKSRLMNLANKHGLAPGGN